MMERLFIFIKHRIKFLWYLIDHGNEFLFSSIYKSKLEKILPGVFKEFALPPYSFRKLDLSDANALSDMIQSQEKTDLEYFKPHAFEIETIKRQLNNDAFLMMGVFDQQVIVGYFFLRFFANKKCFVGRLIAKDYRRRNIGLIMNNIMYEISWKMGFRCLSTISKNNAAVMRAHAKNPNMNVLKKLANDYLLVEFIRKDQ